MKHILISLLIIATLNGCTTRSDFSVLTGKNVNITNLNINKDMLKGVASGVSCQRYILEIPVSEPATLNEALDKALESQKGNILLKAVVKHNSFNLIFYGQDCWKVEGVAYDTFK